MQETRPTRSGCVIKVKIIIHIKQNQPPPSQTGCRRSFPFSLLKVTSTEGCLEYEYESHKNYLKKGNFHVSLPAELHFLWGEKSRPFQLFYQQHELLQKLI